VPVQRAHLESLSIEFEVPIDVDEARAVLASAPGVEVLDDRAANRFPTTLAASNRDAVLVGRLRRDPAVPEGRGLQFICAGDQLRKGAALNAVQIAELLLTRGVLR
jgi:aspartate-semialdehyde dehydrogenase